MANIVLNEVVINKMGEKGTIVSFENNVITVQYKNRAGKLQADAFDKGFLRYEKAELQDKINEEFEQAKLEEASKHEKEEKAKEECKKMEEQYPGVKFNSISVRLDPAPASFNSVKSKHKKLVQDIFTECDKDIFSYYEIFKPEMRYIAPANLQYIPDKYYLRSRYAVGYVTKYLNTYVIRVFSRNDVYKPGKMGGCTVTNSDTTEILRILRVDNETYYFSKHLSSANGSYKNTTLYKKWQASEYVYLVDLNEVVLKCDAVYLNNYIEEKNVNCFDYSKLLMSALFNNKAEILFKNKTYHASIYVDNIEKYLEEYSSKQIDFACKNKVFNALPIIKSEGVYDLNILRKIENIMKKVGKNNSTYENIVELCTVRGFDVSVINKKLVGLIRRDEYFIPAVYRDYISQISRMNDITIDDVFDIDYHDRHFDYQMEARVYYTMAEAKQYKQTAEELSWIDRQENGYYIIIPKTIEDFKFEGHTQHNCVYTMQYYKKVMNKISIIIFLRKKENEPFVTIELDYETCEIKQALGKYNQPLDPDLYSYIENLAKELRFEMISRDCD